jgi:hypothetical protein
MAAPRSAAASSVVVVLQPVSCALIRFSTLTRFHNDNSLVDLTAAHDDDDDADAIATSVQWKNSPSLFNKQLASRLVHSLYNRFCMNLESGPPHN